MGIRIQGSNDTILATDGSWNAEGIDLSAGLNVGTAVTVSARGDIAITGIITASSFSGVTITTINNNADNRLITGSGTADTLNGEANLTFDGDNVTQTIDASGEGINLVADGNHYGEIEFDADRSGADNTLGYLNAKWNNTAVASISFNAGADTTNKDDGYITFNTRLSGSAEAEAMRIDTTGRVLMGTSTEGEASADNLTVADSADCGITIRGGTSSNCSILFSDGTSGTGEYAGNIDYDHNGDYMRIFTAAAEKFRIDSSGHVLPGSDNAQDLGSYAKRWANVHSMDLNLSNEGSQNDVDGSWGSYTIQEGEDDLFLLNRRNGKKYKFNLTEV